MSRITITNGIPSTIHESKRTAATRAVQNYLDSGARSWGYDSIFTACTYADEPSVTQFQNEGKALRQWRSLTWGKCWEIQDQVTSIESLISQLPALPPRPV